MTTKLCLVDGMSHLFRSFYAIRQLANSQGLPTNALFGFTNILRRLVKDEQPDYWAVCWDSPQPTFRHQLASNYKANRAAMPEDLVPQLPYVERLCAALRVALIKFPGYEADDIVGTLAAQGAAQGWQVVIVSNDKDFGQLVNDQIKLLRWDKMEYVVCDAAAIKAWQGVLPAQIIDFLALVGDASDNVAGAPGIGEKGATQLLAEYGTLDNLLANWELVRNKRYRESLRDNVAQIRLAQQLVTIAQDMPLEIDWQMLRRRDPDYPAAHRLFAELEFKRLMQEFSPAKSPVTNAVAANDNNNDNNALLDPNSLFNPNLVNKNFPIDDFLPTPSPVFDDPKIPDPIAAADRPAGIDSVVVGSTYQDYHTIDNEADFTQLVGQLYAQDVISFAAQRDKLGALQSLSFSWKPGQARCLDLSITGAVAVSTIREKLADIWSNPLIKKTTHDAKSALHLLNDWLLVPPAVNIVDFSYQQMLSLQGLNDDTFLAAYLLDPERENYHLEDLTQNYLHLDFMSRQFDMADLTLRLARLLRAQIVATGLERVYLELELPLVEILYTMERWGVAIDTGALAKLAGQFAASLQTLEQEIHTLAGREFNINSPTQLGEILGELNLSTARKTKTGKISTSAEVLEELAAEHPLPAKVLEYREIAKLQNTYVEALPRLINPATGRIHTTINQTGTATGRLSSTNPNLQNIPVRSELGRSIRQAFIAGAGYQLMSADYSQIELRLLAHIAADPVMTTAFQHHEDIHTKTAREVFGAQTDEEVKAKRRLAKATNFGIAYGVGAFGLAERVGISRSEAKVAIENYYATYPGIRHYMTNTPEQARQDNGVVRTLLGRIRRLPGLTERQHNLRARAEREAINAPIQGTAADLVKLAMIKIYQRLRRERRQARLLLQVHDELLLEVPPAEVEAVQRLVTEEMETVYPLNVPLLVAVHVGNNWRDLK